MREDVPSPISPMFGLEDTVFEVDEEETEQVALLTHMNSKRDKHANNDNKHVKFQSENSKKSATTANQSDSMNGAGSPKRKIETSQSESQHHGGQLLRQDAMKESDIEMQDMEKNSPQRKNSI